MSHGLVTRIVLVTAGALSVTLAGPAAVAGAAVRARPVVVLTAADTTASGGLSLDWQIKPPPYHHPRRHRRKHHRPVAWSSPQAAAKALLTAGGWPGWTQWSCLDDLWTRESGWNPYAENPDGAYGIPQALPAGKMASAGADWATDAVTQIRWGLSYIAGVYGSPCAAWAHEVAVGWY